MDLSSSLEIEQRMQNYKKAHAKIQGCVEVDVESEHNESLFKLTPDSEMSLRQTVS